MKSSEYVDTLRSMAFDNVFNPYSDRCSICDLSDAPARRTNILRALLAAATSVELDSIWIGRDLGYRGGRRTGLALTDDMHLRAHAGRWGVAIDRATIGAPVAERTAAVVWDVLALINVPVFLWNVFPLHPHEAGDQFSNRTHNVSERRAGEDLLSELIRLLRPRRLVAIGNDAANTAARLAGAREVINVRHPSYGGQTIFLRQIRSLYDLPSAQTQVRLF